MKNHRIEAELLQNNPPRRVKRRGARGYGTLFSQLLLAPMVALTVFMTVWCLHLLLVRLIGPTASGRIENRYRERSSDGDKVIYFLSYRVNFNGKEIVGKEMVDAASFENTPMGSAVALKLSPIRPGLDSLLLIPRRNIWGVVWGTAFASLIMWAGVGAMVWYLCILPARRRKLVVNGLPVVGRLTAKTDYADSEAHAHYLHYQYSPSTSGASVAASKMAPANAMFEGKQSVHEADWREARAGQSCTVLYDPQNPAQSVLYQFGEYEAIR